MSHWYTLSWSLKFSYLLPHCCLFQSFLAAFTGGGNICWDDEILITLCSGLSLYIFWLPSAVLHVAWCLSLMGLFCSQNIAQLDPSVNLRKLPNCLTAWESDELCVRQWGSSSAYWFFRELISLFHSPGPLTPAYGTTQENFIFLWSFCSSGDIVFYLSI